MEPVRLPLPDTLSALPAEWSDDLFLQIRENLHQTGEKVVVLDDDPTGTQTVHGVPVLTEWFTESLRREFENDLPAFYILTNTRSLLLPEAQSINTAIGRNLVEAAQATGRPFTVISRSDSTLRGHFPGEVDALATALGDGFDAWTLIPFFLEGGRYTIGDVHYVAEGDELVPAGQTQFARDATFGFRASCLPEWVSEKTGGRVPASAVGSISLDDIRRGGPRQVTKRLLALPQGSVCVVNAASMRDMNVFVAGLTAAEEQGKRYLHRTAASFVPARAGISARPLLTLDDLEIPQSGGGLFVVGSYVPKTTAQVDHLLALPEIVAAEIRVLALLDSAERDGEIARVAGLADSALRAGRDVAIYTSRRLIADEDAAKSLAIGQQVSSALVTIVRAISERPRYFVAKGGITSSDLAVKGLDVRRAIVMGQVLPGVPVWRTGPESRFPGLTYVVFPGNVGGPSAVADVRRALTPHLA
jgi:uncharacterized protein YgbK (DUF1537 family)